MSKPKKKLAQVEYRYVDAVTGETLKVEYHERMLFWAGARKGWYMLNMRNEKTYFDSGVDEDPIVIRKIRTVSNNNPL